MSDKCAPNLTSEEHKNLRQFLDYDGGCQNARAAIDRLKAQGELYNAAIVKAGESLGSTPAPAKLPDAVTNALSLEPFDAALTTEGHQGALWSECKASLAATEALLALPDADLASGVKANPEEARAQLKMAAAAWKTMHAQFTLLQNLHSQFLAANDKDKNAAQGYLGQAARGTQEFIGNLNTAGKVALGPLGWIASALADDAVEDLDAENDAIDAASGSVASKGIGGFVANKNYLGTPFREQCFIQSNIFPLVEMRRSGNFVKKTRYPKKTSQACIMAGGSPFGFLNRLTQGGATSALFSIPHEVLSQLQPLVLFYKVSTAADGSLIETPITFPKSTFTTDITDMLKNKNRRGYGVGLKSFKWTYDGSDPFAVKKSIKAEVKIHATSFAELLRPRGGDVPFRYADLAMKTGKIEDKVPPGCNTSTNDTILDPSEKLDFRLKVVVGYAIPKKLDVRRADKEAIDEAIAQSFVTLELTPTIHAFDFDETGRVTFTINYLAYVEDFFDDYYYDIFASSTADSVDAYKFRMQQAFDAATDKARGETPPAIDTDDSKALKALQTRNLRGLMSRLVKRDRMYYYKLPLKSLNEAATGGVLPVYNSNDQILNEAMVKTEIANLRAQAAKSAQRAQKQAELNNRANALQGHLDTPHLEGDEAKRHGSDRRQVTFFFLYDLIDVILDGIYTALNTAYPAGLESMQAIKEAEKVKEKEAKILLSMQKNFQQLRVLLGPMEIANPFKRKEYVNISLGEIPISLKYYSEWMTDKILSRDRTGYTLSAFLNDFMKNYLRNFLNDNACGGDKFRQRASLHSATVSAYSELGTMDNITLYQRLINKGKKPKDHDDVFTGAAHAKLGPFLNTMGSRIAMGPRTLGQENQHNYMMFYAGRVRPDELMTGDVGIDAASGIYHYVMGDARGIVKNIRLDKKSAKGLKELRFEQEGYDGLMQLREVYNVTIDSFLLPNTFPGVYIFVDPRGFAPDTTGYEGLDPVTKRPFPVDTYELSRYGVGGYYMITKSEHTIAEGERSSQILASWVSSKEKPGEDPATGTAVDSADQGVKKCRTQKQKVTMDMGTEPAETEDTVEQNPDPTPTNEADADYGGGSMPGPGAF